MQINDFLCVTNSQNIKPLPQKGITDSSSPPPMSDRVKRSYSSPKHFLNC